MNKRRFFSAPLLAVRLLAARLLAARLLAAPLLAALLFVVAAAAFAQTREDIRIFIPPVAANAEQARFFHQNLSMEISAAGYTITDNENEADYSIRLIVMPNMIVYTDGAEEPAPSDEHQNTLMISLIRNSDNVEVVSLFHRFTDLQEMYHYNLYLHHIYQAINVPMTKTAGTAANNVGTANEAGGIADEAGDPAKKPRAARTPNAGRAGTDTMPLYFGGSVFLSPRLYRSNELSSYYTGVGIDIAAEWHFLRFLSVGTGVELATDAIAASPRFGDEYWNAVLQIPLRLQAVLYPGSIMLQPYGGIAFNFPLLPYTIPPLLSWQAGLQIGIKAGPGIAFTDIRFAMDIGKSGLDKTRPHDTRQYDRYMIYLGVGYKLAMNNE